MLLQKDTSETLFEKIGNIVPKLEVQRDAVAAQKRM